MVSFVVIGACARTSLLPSDCAPADTRLCEATGRIGVQVCNRDGTWGDCEPNDGAGGYAGGGVPDAGPSMAGVANATSVGGSGVIGPIDAGGTAGAGGGEGGAGGSGGESTTPVPIHAGCAPDDKNEFYLLSQAGDLYRFDPDTLELSLPVTLSAAAQANSLALQADGTLFLATDSGGLLTVDSVTGTCTPTAFDTSVWGTDAFLTVGAGDAATDGGAGSLYVTRDTSATDTELYTLDLGSYARTLLKTFTNGTGPEVTQGDDGRLFGLAYFQSDAAIAEYDTSTYDLIRLLWLPTGNGWYGFDIVFLSGDLFAFGGAGSEAANVYRTGTSPLIGPDGENLGAVPINVIGAGARPCP